MVEPDYIDWPGGECPLPPDVVVEAKLLLHPVPIRAEAGWLSQWVHRHAKGDVLAYREVRL